jgi:hypothetical protein
MAYVPTDDLLAARQALDEYEAFAAQLRTTTQEAVNGSIECIVESKDLLKRIAKAATIGEAFSS